MRILVFSWRDPKHPLAGGAEQVMHQHMRGWIEKGNSVTLFSSRFKNSLKNENIDGVEIVRSGGQYLGVQIQGFIYFLINHGNFDFVVDQFHGIPFFVPFFTTRPKLAVIQESAKEVWFLNPLPFPLNIVIGLIGYFCEPFVFLFYKNIKFMTASDTAKKDLLKLGITSHNIVIIPHGVLVEKFVDKPKKNIKPTIVFLGILSKDKGIEDAIETFFELDKKGDYRFWIIGKSESEEYFKKIKEKINSLGLKDKIRFWGFVSQKKKFKLLERSSVLINPSIREGWGLVNTEANSVGTPVVAYNSPGLVDSVKHEVTGVICKENSPQEMAMEVHSIISNKTRYKRLIKSSVEWSKNFTWEKSRAKSMQLINKIYTSS